MKTDNGIALEGELAAAIKALTTPRAGSRPKPAAAIAHALGVTALPLAA